MSGDATAIQQHMAAKPLTFSLLRLLVDGEFHSGEALAQRLSISRTSVSNALRGIENFGLVLYKIRGRGYCLSNPPQWLNAASVEHALGEQAQHFEIEILDSAPSSNTVLLQRAAQGAPSGSVLAVEWQSGGRGRMGRTWHTGLGNALTFSLLWRFQQGLSALSGLSLVAGVALLRALHILGVVSAQLKWPNDVLGKRGKLAGILVEAQGDMLGPSAVVIGMGLNLSLSDNLLAQINQPATSLKEMVATQPGVEMPKIEMPERNILLATILRELRGGLLEFSKHGFAPFQAEWERHHALHHQPVRLSLPDGASITGIARGITDHGALILDTSSGRQIFNSGEIGFTE